MFFFYFTYVNDIIKKLQLFFLLLMVCHGAFGQQQAQYTQSSLNKYHFNPAYAGMDNSLSLYAAYRTQWSGLLSNPKSQNINGHLPLYFLKGAAGLDLSNTQLGSFRQTSINASYNYIVDRSYGLFSIGTKLGFAQGRLSGETLITPDGLYEGSVINHNDPLLPNNVLSSSSVLFGAGVYMLTRKFEIGLSFEHFPEVNAQNSSKGLLLDAHYSLYLEYKFALNNRLKFFPNILVKTDGIETQTDLMFLAKYNGSIFGGIGIRGFNEKSVDALNILAGMQLSERVRISYSFGTGLSNIRRVNEGSHEILINYNFNKVIGQGQSPRIIHNPRHL